MLNCGPAPLSCEPSARKRSRFGPSVPQQPARCFSTRWKRERVVAGRHRRVRREDRRLPDLLERLVEGRAAARSGRESAAARRTRRGLRSDERRPGSTPSALSARTPPMPRMISCWMRVSRSPPYRRADSSRSHGAFSSRSVSSRYSCHAADAHAPDGHEHRSIAERHRGDARLAVRRHRRLDRRVGPVQPLVALFLPAVGRDVLVEVALRVHEADADERHAEVAGFLAVIAGQHAEAARVDRQRLMQRELGGEVRDRLAGELRERARPPGVARRARRVERGDGAVVERAETPDRRRRPRAARAGSTHSMRTGLCAVARHDA